MFSVFASAEDEPSLAIEKYNLSFESNVYIKYAVKVDGIEDSELSRLDFGMLYWTEPQESYELCGESYSSRTVGYQIIDGVKYYVFEFTEFAAKQMADYVYSRAYIVIDGECYYSDVVKYSILDYSYDKLGYDGETTENQTLFDMLVHMLEYGAHAQVSANFTNFPSSR